MKLIIAIIQDKDSNRLSNEFVDSGIPATKSSTTGGFLRAGNTTFIIGIADERVDEVLDIIRETCQSREQFMTPPVSLDVSMETNMPYPIEVQVGGATVFVMPVERFEQF
ncbi:MAG: cyclic-di-AMP receptor [Carnobacterium sp.]|uniref:cyclic-di-AMP receptor n=1 Tax=Carnobacterium sp. TMP28 TaxID=3397060 RepID=UPI001D85131E|nr:cyclic-di-AMP receptor [Carnobacterium sp.]